MSNLPPQLLFDILVRLLPKDLIRFRWVSKDWYAFIGNQHFIRAQLQRSIQTNCARSILYDNGELGFLLFPFDDEDTIGTEAEKIELPLNCPGRFYVRGSSIHGVVVIRNSADGGTLALWNPSIRKLKKIPSPPFEFEAPQPHLKSQIHYAFGYDSANDDYKIVEIRQLYKTGKRDFTVLRTHVSILSLRSHSWKRIQDMPCNGFRLLERPAFLNGGLSWVIYKEIGGTENKILTLDLATEEYSHCPMPTSVDRFDSLFMFLVALGDCLCICKNNHYGGQQHFLIMKEFGVRESWTLLCSFAGKANNCEPLAFSKNCERVLAKRNTGELFWVDIEKKIEEEVEIHGLLRYVTPTICVGSLCLLDGETYN